MSISQRRVFDWLQERQNHSTSSSCRNDLPNHKVHKSPSSGFDGSLPLSSRSTKQLTSFEIEKQIFDWVQSQLPTKVSSTAIREKAIELYRASGHTTNSCSYGWYRRWSSRFQIPNNPHEETDAVILTWILKQLDQNIVLSSSEVQDFAKAHISIIRPGFKASSGWVSRFFKRNYILLSTTGASCNVKLPSQIQHSIDAFLNRLHNDVLTNGEFKKIGCMDEIPISFAEFQTNQIARGRKYSICNCDATILLTLMSDGSLLPPFVIMKGQNACDINQIYIQDNSIVLYYCNGTAPTIQSLENWYELIWTKHVQPNEKSLLLMDDYVLHQHFKTKFSKCFSMELFPEGTSIVLQPLNHSVVREFSKCIELRWNDLFSRSGTTVIVPRTDEIIKWIEESYEAVLREQKNILSTAFTRAKIIL